MKYFKYPCGCSFPLDDSNGDKKIIFDPNIENLNLDCSRTWDLISSGNTKGVFQLESRLGRSIAKKLKPENMEQLSALISILRPGCLEAMRDGKSVTNHYIDKKNGQESINYFHSSLEPILVSTLGELIYQEQAMEIAKDIAGFDLQQADELRKAIGKKLADKMAAVKIKFIEGAKNQKIVTEDEAEQIFGWIEKSQRYSFNKSHAVSYAMNAYLSAYTKAHFPKIFFASYLRFAKDKMDPQDEIKALVQNASEMDITVHTPDIRNLNQYFVLKNEKIYFGLTDIKGVGESVYKKLIDIVQNYDGDLSNIQWLELLFKILLNINSTAAKALIESGATSFINKTRSSMLFEYNIASGLTKKECEIVLSQAKNLEVMDKAIDYLLVNSKVNKNRKKIIEDAKNLLNNPPYSLEDNPEWIADSEDTALGCAITCSKIDIYDISMTNSTCRDFKNGNQKTNIIIGGEVSFINVTKTKTGQMKGSDMAFVNICDQTGCIDTVIFFPEQYKQYKSILFENNIIIVIGSRSKTGDGLIVEKAYIAKT
jgi:DNA polymerase-3 subunit alpha